MAKWNYRNSEATVRGTPDAELVLGARRGEKRAFVEIVARHQAMRSSGFSRKMVPRNKVAKDCCAPV